METTKSGRSDGAESRVREGVLSARNDRPDWLDKVIANAKGLAFQSPTLKRAMSLFDEPITKNRSAYARFLEDSVILAAEFSRIIEQFGCVPIDYEFHSVHREARAMIRERARYGGRGFFIEVFDAGGPVMHTEAETAEHALDLMLADGFVLFGCEQVARDALANRSRSGCNGPRPPQNFMFGRPTLYLDDGRADEDSSVGYVSMPSRGA